MAYCIRYLLQNSSNTLWRFFQSAFTQSNAEMSLQATT